MHTFTCVSRVCIASLLLLLLLLSTPRASLFLVSLCRVRRYHPALCFILLFLSQTDNFSHHIDDVSRRLSGICRLSPALLQISLPCYVFSLLSVLRVCLPFSCISPLVQNLASALWKKNKHPFFCADCTSLLCPVFTFRFRFFD